MTALFLTVLLASLLGSLHCAGMCGAFVAFAIGAGDPAVKTPRGLLLGLYQAGRLVTYVALGAAAGTLGAGLDMGGHIVGVQRAAAILSGAMMVGFGALTLLRLSGVKLKAARPPAALTAAVAGGHRRALRYSPPVRALATGLLTTLLPCGWLYGFVIIAAGTGHAWAGAGLMATFWGGTLPTLTLVSVGIRKLAFPLAAKLPAIAAGAIVVAGLYTIVARANIALPHAAITHGRSAEELLLEVKAIDHEKLPCCTTQPSEEGAVK